MSLAVAVIGPLPEEEEKEEEEEEEEGCLGFDLFPDDDEGR
jgi:hypothetical protein